MKIVLVNPITKKPTGCEPIGDGPRIFDGPYQNVAEVTDEWFAAENVILHRIMASVLTAREIERAAERERCAKVVDDAADITYWDPEAVDELRLIAANIRSSK